MQTLQVAIMMMTPYITYLIADSLGLSGIVSILINGIFLAAYAN